MTTIRVTQHHIDQGEKADPCRCPVALATTEALALSNDLVLCVGPCEWPAGKYDVTIMTIEGKTERRAFVPDEVRTWISDFDYDRPVSPVEFELEL